MNMCRKLKVWALVFQKWLEGHNDFTATAPPVVNPAAIFVVPGWALPDRRSTTRPSHFEITAIFFRLIILNCNELF